MEKNELVTVAIEDIGASGEGIGKINGFTLFIKDAVIGDIVEAKIMKLRKHYGYARLVNILEPSPYRVEARCPFARKCGGCQIQEMSYERQLAFKYDKVRNNLKRIGGFDEALLDAAMEPAIIGMEHPFFYRNKAQFPFGTDKNGEPIAGFYAGRTHDIVANTDCMLGVPVNREILEITLRFLRKYHIPAYHEKTGRGLFRHVLIRYGFRTKEIMVCYVINGTQIPHSGELIEKLSELKGMASISVSPNTKKSNVIMGESFRVLWGKGYITDFIGDIRYQISPLSFYQVNPVQTEKLYGRALDYAGLTGNEIVWDLYCGIGTISLFLARKAKQVYGVEAVPQAVEDAKKNARMNGITNVGFYVGKAEEVLPAYYEKCRNGDGQEEAHADVIVVDPPRKGCGESLLWTMKEMKPERMVYVSCDSATLARDLRVLCEGEYEIKKIGVVDLFPMTGHVETVVMLSHKKPDSVINVKVEFGEGEGKVPLDNIAKKAAAYKPKERVTYKMIKEYIEAKYGFKVHTAYIAEVKRDLGLPMYDAPNAVEELKQPRKHPTAEKVEAIKDALKHFDIVK